jgi:hypothetical protein
MSEYEEDEIQLITGRAEKMDGGPDDEDGEFGRLAAVLWVPDPTERGGWRDVWIGRKKDSKPKSMGFGRRR